MAKIKDYNTKVLRWLDMKSQELSLTAGKTLNW